VCASLNDEKFVFIKWINESSTTTKTPAVFLKLVVRPWLAKGNNRVRRSVNLKGFPPMLHSVVGK
jgi:hypothetical protein